MNNLPPAYVDQMKRLLGEAGFFAYARALCSPVTRALRVNLLRCPDGVPPCEIEGLGAPVPWAKGAYFVEGDARPGLSPLHEGGLYYLQEPSALSAVTALDPRPGERILDLCAAPGGKSTQIAALMGGRGLLVCNVVTSALPDALAERFPAFFDRILVDAPCSGEGMFRRQLEARDEWSENAPRGCADRQLKILESACRMLAPGGTMVYSTCTFNDTENEGVLARLLDAHPELSPVPFALPGLPEAKDGYVHLYPHEIRGEGHFVSLLRKRADAPGAPETLMPETLMPETLVPETGAPKASARGKKALLARKPGKDAPGEAALPQGVLRPGVSFLRLHPAGGALWSLPEGIDIARLDGLRVLRTGLLLAHAEGRRMEPDHALAMALSPEQAARTAELTHDQALLYQAGEALALGERESGYTLLTCCGVPLGFGKQAGGLMKNHYPKGLRRR